MLLARAQSWNALGWRYGQHWAKGFEHKWIQFRVPRARAVQLVASTNINKFLYDKLTMGGKSRCWGRVHSLLVAHIYIYFRVACIYIVYGLLIVSVENQWQLCDASKNEQENCERTRLFNDSFLACIVYRTNFELLPLRNLSFFDSHI